MKAPVKSPAHQRIYQGYIANGICPQCRRADVAAGRSKCQSCLDKNRLYQRRLRAARTSAGLCICGAPPAPGGVSCKSCREANRLRSIEQKRARAEQRLCVSCGGEIEHDRERWATCQRCSDRHKALYEAGKGA